MSEDETNLEAAAGASAPPRSWSKRLALIAIEVLLVAIIVGLLIATWLPAIIGANPDAPRDGRLP